ncbi:hypothetical protein MMC13_003617 [Lambiella insularis]|nr:hypothetical protein [Lambiella insularis]
MEIGTPAEEGLPPVEDRAVDESYMDDEAGTKPDRRRRGSFSACSPEEIESYRSDSPPRRRRRRYEKVEILPDLPRVYYTSTYLDEEYLDIVSPLIVALFRKVVSFYPAVIFRQGSIEMVAPFSPLYHYFHEMKARVSSEDSSPELLEHFEIIERFIGQNLSKRYQEIRDSLTTDKSISFDDLWALYKPGDYVVIKDGLHQKLALVFTDIELKKHNRNNEIQRPFPYYTIMAWCVVWIPSEKLFQRRSWKLKVARYPGKRRVLSLPVYPLHAVPEAERGKLLAHLRDRGERWRTLISGPALCFMHTGPAFKSIARDEDLRRGRYRQDGGQTTNLVGRVIVEEQKLSAYSQSPGLLPGLRRNLIHLISALMAIADSGIFYHDRPEFEEWDDKAPNTAFNDEQRLLCPPTIACFDITTAKWYVVAVDNLKPVVWNTAAMNHLVLADSRKTLLRAVIEQHAKKHVGKTLTAESVAESTKRPLVPMSIQALISDGKRFESNLGQLFSNARRWNAILLLDEADIVLEARSFEDIGRNGIVSVFLRQLEYYGGILFLTTNRISTMDDAFQSRIQIAFDYKPLDRTTRRQIWSNLIASNAIEIADDARDSVEDALDDLSRLDLNGRQIRNTLNMAESLANDDFATPGQLQREHITKAADATLKFKKMFNEAKKTAKGNARTVWAPYGSAGGEPSEQVTKRVSSWDLS